jgi:hypothetical protein
VVCGKNSLPLRDAFWGKIYEVKNKGETVKKRNEPKKIQ